MRKFILYLFFSPLIILSCQKILFNEDEGTREFAFGDFHSVRISGIYDLVLIQDSANRLVVTGKNNISFIDAIVIDDTLIIDNNKKRSFNPNRNKLELHFSDLNHIITYDPVNISNTGTIKADQFTFVAQGEIAEVRLKIDCNHFFVFNSANTLGYFHFIGKAGSCLLWNRYGSRMFADSLLCKYAEVYNESIGDVNINASDYIKAFIRGPGNICYHGIPVIEIAEKRGRGKLIRLD